MDATPNPNAKLSKSQLEELKQSAIVGDTTFFDSLTKLQLLKAIEHRDETGLSLLHVAATNGQFEVVRILAENDSKKSSINDMEKQGRTPIHFASKCGSVQSVLLLIIHGADIDMADIDGKTALHYAAGNGWERIAMLLILCSANVNAKDKLGNTPLHHAASIGSLELCELFLENGAEIDAVDICKLTPLINAAIYAHKEVEAFLIRNGAKWEKLNEIEEGSKTILKPWPKNLQDAVSDALKEMASLSEDKFDELKKSAIKGDTTLFDSLTRLERIKATQQRDETGLSLLHVAATNGHSEVVKILVENDLDNSSINDKDNHGRTPIHFASISGNVDVLLLLITHGADVNMTNFFGKTGLHYAAKRGWLPIAKTLVLVGAHVNARDKAGNTPLHNAACIGNLELCELFLQHGAEIDAVDTSGLTPLMIAAIRAKKEVVVLLIRRGAKWEELHSAEKGYKTFLEFCPDLEDVFTNTLKEIGVIVDSLQEKRKTI
ncbi:hypothetical protein BVRB_6g137160 isoform A [Beta vulgaris subsp. vulgaris]|nr:hypothetical protein BVRB_6g137160 isoform A [Beta vulgaris subsp. vulgaris]